MKDERKISILRVIEVIVESILTLIFAQILAELIGSVVYLLPIPKGFAMIVAGLLYPVIAYVILKIIVTKRLKLQMSEVRLDWRKPKGKWILIAVLLPVIVAGAYFCMEGELIKSTKDMASMFELVATAVFYYGIGAGLVEEMVFRGVIMTVVEKRWGRVIAIAAPSILFAAVHLMEGKLDFISVLMLMVSGTAVGVMFSMIVYESKSVWCSAVVHMLWNSLIGCGILKISTTVSKDYLFTYQLQTNQRLLTGGDFGAESSIISVLGYFIVIGIAVWGMKKNR